VDAAAKVTSKGQVTLPKTVREALGIESGDEVVFRVEGDRAVLARTPDFLELAGSVSVPRRSATRLGMTCCARRGSLEHCFAGERLRRYERPHPAPHG